MSPISRIISLALLALLFLAPMAQAKPSLTVTVPYGLLIVQVEKDGAWHEVRRLGFTHLFKEEKLDLTGFVDEKRPARVRIVRSGGGKHAHLEVISLGGAAPSTLAGGDIALALKADNDVMPLSEQTELTFPPTRDGNTLSLIARVEPEEIGKTPFLYPPANKGDDLTAATHFYDYTIGRVKGSFKLDGDATQVDAMKPLFNVHSVPGSGHPEGATMAWVKDDGEKLYVALEFTPDNTVDGPVDYAKVYAVGPKGAKEYRLTEVENQWGNAGFTTSKRAAYHHKFYEFALPLSDVGAATGDELKLAFAAYGTASVTSPPNGSTINFGTVTVNNATPLTQTVQLSGNDTFTAQVTTGDATMFTVNAGTCSVNTTISGQQKLFNGGVNGAPNPCAITVTFTPTSLGVKNSTMKLWTTSTPGTVKTVTLTGTGQVAGQPVNLTMYGWGRVTSSDGMFDCSESCAGSIGLNFARSNAIVNTTTLTATAHPNYSFDRWGGDCSGVDPVCTPTNIINRSAREGSGATPNVGVSTINVTATFTKRPIAEIDPANQPPTPPAGAGSEWIVSPAPDATVAGTPAFIWKALTDPDGKEVTYQLWVCKDGDFANCTPTTVTATVTQRVAAGAAVAGALLLAFGFTRQGRRVVMIVGATMLIGGSTTLVACGSSSTGATDATTDGGSTTEPTAAATTCTVAASDEVCYDGATLTPGTYGWKVVAEDGDKLTTVSEERTFTVE